VKKKSIICLLFLFISTLSNGFAQYSQTNFASDSVQVKKSKKLNPGLGKEVFSGKNLAIFGASLGGAFLLDEWAKDHIQSHQSNFLKQYTDVATVFGEKKIMAPATLATWGIGLAIKDERLTQTALNSGKALITGAILTESIKFIAGRSRPDMNRGNMHFDAFGGTTNNTKSFPSGHAFVAWSVFTPFAMEYSKWIYLIPASVSFARMYRSRHWFSDVVLGSGIGYFAGLYFHKRKNQRVLFSGNGLVIKF
jgi:membrane-associated phospholipid phosphatase